MALADYKSNWNRIRMFELCRQVKMGHSFSHRFIRGIIKYQFRIQSNYNHFLIFLFIHIIILCRWKFISQSITVTVKEGNTDLPENSLVIAGYDVRGIVKSDGLLIKGAVLMLHGDEVSKILILFLINLC